MSRFSLFLKLSGCLVAFVLFAGTKSGPTGCLGGFEYTECAKGQTSPCPGPDAKGACKKGNRTCSDDGTWGACLGAIEPVEETCDGIDNNCDGNIDEKLQRECYDGPDGTAGKGLCKKGTQTCKDAKWTRCEGEVKPEATEACDGSDNNCDGQVDEGCTCKPNETQDCGVEKGECKKGTQTCGQDGKWGECKGEVKTAKETCDGKDNDCDGTIDNGQTLCPSGEACKNGKCEGGTNQPFRSGQFQSGAHPTQGKVSIFKEKDGTERIDFDATFKSDSGPDLKVYLVEDPKGDAGTTKWEDLGSLKNTSGAQSYTAKSTAGFKSVVIWCVPFKVNFGFATLTP